MEDGHASVYTVRTNRPPALAALYSNRLRRGPQSAASALSEWAELQRHRLRKRGIRAEETCKLEPLSPVGTSPEMVGARSRPRGSLTGVFFPSSVERSRPASLGPSTIQSSREICVGGAPCHVPLCAAVAPHARLLTAGSGTSAVGCMRTDIFQ